VMLYALQIGMAMIITGSMMFAADRSSLPGQGGRGELVLVTGVLALAWLVAVFVPFTAIWVLPTVAPGEPLFPGVLQLGALDWAELMLPTAVLAGLAAVSGASYARAARAGRAPDLKRPFLHRAICLAAFVFFGPTIYGFVMAVGELMAWPLSPSHAIVLAYASCEAYPFAATLVDRWRGRRQRNT
jgi:hypothetical protein